MVMDLFSKETEGWFILSLAGRKIQEDVVTGLIWHNKEVRIMAERYRQRIAQTD